MPDMNGLEMVRELRNKNSSIPVIIISAYTDPEHTIDAIKLGAADFIAKPFSLNELYHSIGRILRMEHEQGILSIPLVQSGKFSWEFTTDDFDIAGFSNLLSTLVTHGNLIPKHERNSFYTVIFETLTNAREHGNIGLRSHIKGEDMIEFQNLLNERLKDPQLAQKKIYIHFEYDEQQICIRIRDEGDGFDHTDVDSQEFYNHEHLMKLHGKGLLIIKSYMDRVSFSQKGNEITLIKNFKPSKNPQ